MTKADFFAPDGLFAADDAIRLRCIGKADMEAYLDIQREKPTLQRMLALDVEGLYGALWDAFTNENDFNCAIVGREDGCFYGYCGLQKYRSDAPELQIELLRAWRRHGIGGRALRLLMAHYTHLTGQRFYIANVAADNVASQSLMRKLGGVPRGVIPFPGATEEMLRLFDSSDRAYDRALYAALAREFSTTERALKSHVLSFRIPAPIAAAPTKTAAGSPPSPPCRR